MDALNTALNTNTNTSATTTTSQQSDQEPVSGAKGAGNITEPYDQGNQEGVGKEGVEDAKKGASEGRGV